MYIKDWVAIQDMLLDPDNSYLETLIGSGFQSDPG